MHTNQSHHLCLLGCISRKLDLEQRCWVLKQHFILGNNHFKQYSPLCHNAHPSCEKYYVRILQTGSFYLRNLYNFILSQYYVGIHDFFFHILHFVRPIISMDLNTILKSMGMAEEREITRESFHLMIHFPNAQNSCGLVRQRSEFRSFI